METESEIFSQEEKTSRVSHSAPIHKLDLRNHPTEPPLVTRDHQRFVIDVPPTIEYPSPSHARQLVSQKHSRMASLQTADRENEDVFVIAPDGFVPNSVVVAIFEESRAEESKEQEERDTWKPPRLSKEQIAELESRKKVTYAWGEVGYLTTWNAWNWRKGLRLAVFSMLNIWMQRLTENEQLDPKDLGYRSPWSSTSVHREGWPDVSVAFRGSDWLGIVSEITDSEVRDYISLFSRKTLFYWLQQLIWVIGSAFAKSLTNSSDYFLFHLTESYSFPWPRESRKSEGKGSKKEVQICRSTETCSSRFSVTGWNRA